MTPVDSTLAVRVGLFQLLKPIPNLADGQSVCAGAEGIPISNNSILITTQTDNPRGMWNQEADTHTSTYLVHQFGTMLPTFGVVHSGGDGGVRAARHGGAQVIGQCTAIRTCLLLRRLHLAPVSLCGRGGAQQCTNVEKSTSKYMLGTGGRYYRLFIFTSSVVGPSAGSISFTQTSRALRLAVFESAVLDTRIPS